MSRIYDALRKSEQQLVSEPFPTPDTFLETMEKGHSRLDQLPVERIHIQPQNRVVVVSDPHGLGAERFRFLRTRLDHWPGPKKIKSLLITSPIPQDGKSTVAVNLAGALAGQEGRTVLLLGCDLRRPSLPSLLGITPWPGLIRCLAEGLDPFSAIRRIEPLGFFFLPAGETVSNPVEVLESPRFPALLRTLTGQFDWILLDSPPVSPMADVSVLKTHVDGSLVVVRAGVTPKESVEEAVELLGADLVIGMILNEANSLEHAYYQYYHRYAGRDGHKGRSWRPVRS